MRQRLVLAFCGGSNSQTLTQHGVSWAPCCCLRQAIQSSVGVLIYVQSSYRTFVSYAGGSGRHLLLVTEVDGGHVQA